MINFSFPFISFILLFSIPHIYAQHQDCETSLELCDNSPFHIVPDSGIGLTDPGIGSTCVLEEFNSFWVKWTVLESGIITLVLTPDTVELQDIDFIIFQSAGDYDCTKKSQIRCMAAGANVGQPPSQWANCAGATGLAMGETDIIEPPGCTSSSNNFLAPIEAFAGDQFIMLINEFSESGYGYTFSFTGTAVLACTTDATDPEAEKPQANFALYPTLSTGTIHIKIPWADLSDTRLSFFNMAGQMVYANEQVNETAFQIDLHHLPPGAYFAVLRTSHATQTQKFLLTR